MGVISDAFNARLEELKQRHEESARRIDEHVEATRRLIAAIDALDRDLDEA